MGSKDKSVMVQDTNTNINKPEDNRDPVFFLRKWEVTTRRQQYSKHKRQ